MFLEHPAGKAVRTATVTGGGAAADRLCENVARAISRRGCNQWERRQTAGVASKQLNVPGKWAQQTASGRRVGGVGGGPMLVQTGAGAGAGAEAERKRARARHAGGRGGSGAGADTADSDGPGITAGPAKQRARHRSGPGTTGGPGVTAGPGPESQRARRHHSGPGTIAGPAPQQRDDGTSRALGSSPRIASSSLL
jgi:hypothetical protein